MERKKLIILIAVGVLAVILLSILIVGIVDGIWPWDGPKAYAKIFQPKEKEPVATQPATQPSEETPTGDDEETPTVSGEQQNNTSQPTTGNPLIDGEDPTGGSDVKEEVDLGGNNTGTGGNTGTGDNTGTGGNTGTGDNTGNGDNTGDSGNTGGTGDLSDADHSVSGGLIPNW